MHLVEHHPPVMASGNQLPQSLRCRQQMQIQGMIEHVEVDRVREPQIRHPDTGGALWRFEYGGLMFKSAYGSLD